MSGSGAAEHTPLLRDGRVNVEAFSDTVEVCTELDDGRCAVAVVGEETPWYKEGLWRAPTLMTEWHPDGKIAVTFEKNRKITWSELFGDLIIVTNMAKLGDDLREGDSIANYALYFLAIWYLWTMLVLYSVWLHTDDLFSKMMLAGVMATQIGVGMHIKGGPETPNGQGFAVCFAMASAIVGGALARACWYLPRFRYTGATLAAQNFMQCVLWLLSAFVVPDERRAIVWWVTVFLQPLMMLVMQRIMSRSQRVPLHLPVFIERFGLFVVISLGEAVTGLTVNPTGVSSRGAFYGMGILGFLVVFALKQLYFDVDHVELEDHALRTSIWRAMAWSYSHPVLVGSIAMLGSGLEMLLSDEREEEPEYDRARARRFVCIPLALCFLMTIAHRLAHDNPRACKERDDRGRRCIVVRGHADEPCRFSGTRDRHAFLQLLVYHGQLATQLIVGGVCVGLSFVPSDHLSDVSMLAVLASMSLFIVAINLADEAIDAGLGWQHPAHSAHGASHRNLSGAGGGGGGGAGSARKELGVSASNSDLATSVAAVTALSRWKRKAAGKQTNISEDEVTMTVAM